MPRPPRESHKLAQAHWLKELRLQEKNTFKLKLHFLRLGTLLALILPINTIQDMSEKALQCVEVQRAICKAALLWLIKTGPAEAHRSSSHHSMVLKWELNEYLTTTFFLLCMLLQGSPHLIKGSGAKSMTWTGNMFFPKSYKWWSPGHTLNPRV